MYNLNYLVDVVFDNDLNRDLSILLFHQLCKLLFICRNWKRNKIARVLGLHKAYCLVFSEVVYSRKFYCRLHLLAGFKNSFHALLKAFSEHVPLTLLLPLNLPLLKPQLVFGLGLSRSKRKLWKLFRWVNIVVWNNESVIDKVNVVALAIHGLSITVITFPINLSVLSQELLQFIIRVKLVINLIAFWDHF